MAIIGGDQGKAGESKGSGRKADDLRLSCLCLLLLPVVLGPLQEVKTNHPQVPIMKSVGSFSP